MENSDRKPIIYWNDLREGYNDQYNTTHKTVEDFVRKVYLKHGAISRASKILGVSSYALWRKMQALNIPRLQRGHRGACKTLRAVWQLDNISKMTSSEIAKATGFTRNWILVVLRRHNIPFARDVRREAGIWNRIKPIGENKCLKIKSI